MSESGKGPSDPATIGSAPTEPAPALSEKWRRIGPYRLLQRLGEGGMGEVWLAEQLEPVRRKVALKIIKRGLDTEQVVARFEAERQALALMDHPCVAKVFDAGSTAEGRPYFVMEHIRGVPLTEHCDRERLTTRERLELFVQVCEGVQHAHQKAIIHRDLKPSNVLVALQDGRPVPKIIDFGVAKATSQRLTDRTLFTEQGVLIGTPEYMSPEQAEMTGQDIDTRTDVYSLGVMLYEMLVGALPFDPKDLRAAGFDGIRRKIREEEPPKPTTRLGTMGGEASTESARRRHVDVPTLRRQLAGDLDWITMKALEKDRARRYGSPAELAAEIDRHLTDQPVLAGPPSVAYRTRKFVRRHTIGVAVAVASLLVLLGFAVTMTWQAERIARERDRADREAKTANESLDFLTGLFKVSDPGEARGKALTAREVLDTGAKRIESELADEPAIQTRLLMTIGQIYVALGVYDAAEPLLERSLSLRRRVLGNDNPDTLSSIYSIGNLLRLRRKLPEAEPYLREALEGRRRVLGDENVATLDASNSLGVLLSSQGRFAEAETLFRKTLEGRQRAFGRDSAAAIGSLNNMGILLDSQGKHAEAEPYFREALEGWRRIHGDDHPETLAALNNLAILFTSEGKLKEAEVLYRQSLESRRRVLGNDHPITLEAIYSMGYILQQEGLLKEAEGMYLEAIEGSRRVNGKGHEDTLDFMANLGGLYIDAGRLSDAESILRDAVAGASSLQDASRVSGMALYQYGRCLTRLKRYAEAEASLLKAYSSLPTFNGDPDLISQRDPASLLADLYSVTGKPDKAAEWRAKLPKP